MNRHIVYPGQIPLETDLLNVAKDAYVGLSGLAQAIIGSTPVLSGFAVAPTGPASMTVSISPGQIYAPEEVDPTDYSSLGTDTTTHIKQGLMLAPTTPPIGTFPAPSTAGQSINYLIQIGYLSSDTDTIVLPYYNSSNPSIAWSGPGNTGSSQATIRADLAVVSVVAGTAATTGTQTTPTPSSGCVGAYVVTVANGQTSILSGNISVYSNASFIGNQATGFSINTLAPINSPAFTGTPTAPTPAPLDNSSKLAPTAYVDAAVAVGGTYTGHVSHYFGLTAPAGWVARDGTTIGDATSGATGRANADTQSLFVLIWTNTTNTTDGGSFQLQNSSGAPIARGSSALADYAANCRIPLPDDRGLFDRGLDTGGAVDPSRVLATAQADAFGSHTHNVHLGYGSGPITGVQVDYLNTTFITTDATGGTETRPKNRAYLPIIKL